MIPVGEITEAKKGALSAGVEPPLPVMVKSIPQSKAPMTDIHRFWEQTGNFYARGMGNDNITDPFIGLGVMPATSALFRDMTGIRFEHPEFDPQACTACGKCYTICPDTAMPGLVTEVGQVFDTVVRRLRKKGHEIKHLPKAARIVERHLRALCKDAADTAAVAGFVDQAVDRALQETDLTGEDKQLLQTELDLLREHVNGFPFALSRPYYALPEQQSPGSGGLFSIAVNPYTCKGCMECVEVCGDDALRPVTQTEDSVEKLRESLATVQQIQAGLRTELTALLSQLQEWNEFQDVVQQARALRDAQKDVEYRTRTLR